jgi:predicted enzyme related to lactoylglutathione lyase
MKTLVNVDVPNLALAIDFYSSAVDLTCNRIIDGDVAEMVGASSVIYFLQKSAGTSYFKNSASVRAYARHWTPVHLDFVIDDIAVAKEQAISAGAICESELVEWAGSKCMTFSDPFGHGFCLIEFSADTYQDFAE